MTENNGRDSGGTNWKEFPIWFAALKPKEKIETMLALMPYAVPRLQSISMTDGEGKKVAVLNFKDAQ